MKKILKRSGFTLIELIIVVAIIALLAAASFVAINPGKRVGDANNAKRWSDVTAIADAYSAYLVDNGGTPPTSTLANLAGIAHSITSSTQAFSEKCSGETGSPTTTARAINLASLVTSGYIGAIPSEPTYVSGDLYNTGYYFYTELSGKLVIGSCATYNSAVINVVR